MTGPRTELDFVMKIKILISTRIEPMSSIPSQLLTSVEGMKIGNVKLERVLDSKH